MAFKGKEIAAYIRYRADHDESIEKRHAEVMKKVGRVGPPFGFAGLHLPRAPDCGDGLSASYWFKMPTRGIALWGTYIYRGENYICTESATFDDYLRYSFKTSNKAIDYPALLHEHFPEVIEAFQGYKAQIFVDGYSSAYAAGSLDEQIPANEKGYLIENNLVYNRLLADKSVDVNGRNNIYTLYPVQYWDATLCQRALGYGPDEVIRRLKGKVPKAERLMDGVYLVLNDDPALTYQDFLAMNETIKPILGLL